MKFYRTYATTDLGGKTGAMWATSQASAAAQRKYLYGNGFKRAAVATEEVDVPTTKQELCEWLNAHIK